MFFYIVCDFSSPEPEPPSSKYEYAIVVVRPSEELQ